MFNYKKNLLIGFALVILMLNIPNFILFGTVDSYYNNENIADKHFNDDNIQDLKKSDVAGSELYSEQINAYVAGAKSIIQQSLFTNDSNIFPNMDFNDPAFYLCTMMLTASNGKVSEMFPSILGENVFSSQLSLSHNSFFGFLFYEEEIEHEDAQKRAERAFKIIKNVFEIDLFRIDTSEKNFFPFIGYYPNWEIVLNRLYVNLPKDGYWKALDLDRLLSNEYLEKQHLSFSILLLNSLEIYNEGINITSSQFNYDISDYALPFLETFNMGESNETTEGLEGLFGGFGEFLGIEDLNQTFLEGFDEILGSGGGMLDENNRYVTMKIQYEGNPEGIEKITGSNNYKFDLFKAMGYNETTLYPSEKMFIAIIGTFMSEIEINILSTDIIDVSPKSFQFSDDLIEDLEEIIWLADIEFDINSLTNYEFIPNWVNIFGVNKLYTLPINPINESDIINFLDIIGFDGLPYILTGLLNPIESLIVSYSVANSEPNLKITKIVENASYGIDRTFQINITTENVGNTTAWGVPTKLPIDYEELLNAVFFLPGSREDIEDYFEESLITLLNLDEDPRLFHFDSSSIGITDTFYPNITNLLPYNEEFVEYLVDHPPYNIYAPFFNNSDSIFNEENWKLEPGESISYTLTNVSIEDLDTYTPFATNNFIENEEIPLPAINYGSTHIGTKLNNAHIQDGIDWIIDSEEKIVDYHIIDIDFVFENKSFIDLTNNILNRVRIYMNATSDSFSEDVSFHFYNFTSERLENITEISSDNNTYIFEFIDDEINGLFDPASNNHTLFFNLKIISNDAFNLSIDSIYVNFSFREIVPYLVLSAKVSYSSELGLVTYSATSNNLYLSTYNMSSILAIASLENYASYPGQENTYFVELTNIGSMNAENVYFSIPIPGIIKNKNSFQVKNGTITQKITEINPGQTIKLSFTFYSPNSINILNSTVVFKNQKIMNESQSSLTIHSNDVYISAPIDYEKRYPFLHIIKINYSTNNTHPKLNDFINLSIQIENQGPANFDIPDILIEISDNIEGLKRLDNDTLDITDLSWKETKVISMIFQKTSYRGYYYPAINVIFGSESSTLRINTSIPIILGYIDFEIHKNVSEEQVINGKEIFVTVEVINIGNIAAQNVTLDDMNSFFQQQFYLTEGTLVHFIQVLEPGETFTFSYTIIGKEQGEHNLSAACIDYYYLIKRPVESNSIQMKIILDPNMQRLSIIIPCVVVLFFIGSYGFLKKRYRSNMLEKKRKEDEILNATKFTTILRHKESLNDSLERVSTLYGGKSRK